jgi:hypothetical protein
MQSDVEFQLRKANASVWQSDLTLSAAMPTISGKA